MIILAIETSCDETAISIVDGRGGLSQPRFRVLSQIISSQTAIHAHWGGVVPSLAKREHAKNLVPILATALTQAKLAKKLPRVKIQTLKSGQIVKLKKILEREVGLFDQLIEFLPTIKTPKIDAIAVTIGPGLEPALWVGINFAKALALVWDKPLVPVNHMEGHIYSVLLADRSGTSIKFPAVALLVSGGHTELWLVKDWLKYRLLGQTRDDAAGEAFDKSARLLGLPYPGGPAIAKLARQYEERGDVVLQNLAHPPQAESIATGQPANIRALENNRAERLAVELKLPRPMLHSPDFDFSFSGLKTAVLYGVKKLPQLTTKIKQVLAHEIQAAIVEVLAAKSLKAVAANQARSLIVAGGVSANQKLREVITRRLAEEFPDVSLLLPDSVLATDNATMIGIAAYLRQLKSTPSANYKLHAQGNLALS